MGRIGVKLWKSILRVLLLEIKPEGADYAVGPVAEAMGEIWFDTGSVSANEANGLVFR